MKSPVAVLFANVKGNIGDFAILHAILRDLTRRFPGQPLHVFPHGFYRADERRLAAFRAASPFAFELAGTTYLRRGSAQVLDHMIRSVGLWPRAQADHIQSLAEAAAADACRFSAYDAIFLAGGDHWGGTDGAVSMFGTLSAVHAHNDRIFAFPFSVKPKISKFNTASDLRHYFGKIRQPLIARDGITRSVLDGLGVHCVLGTDCVFSLQDEADAVAPMPSRSPSRVLLSVTGGRGRLEGDLRSALRRLDRSGTEVALMTTCEVEDGAAYAAAAREFGVAYLAPATWQEAVAEMKASALLVANRLHGLILGTLARTPVVPVVDRKKAEAFARDARMPHSAPAVRALGSDLIDRCLADRTAILAQMSRFRDDAHKAEYSPSRHAVSTPCSVRPPAEPHTPAA